MGDLHLTAPKAKTHRAEVHLKDLDGVVNAFLDGEPYEVVPEIEAETGDKVYRVRIREEVPQSIALIAGDVIHNARAALDILYCDLVRATGKVVAESDTFPIHDTAKKFRARSAEIRGRIGKDPAQILQVIEPYKGGNGETIWALHRLDITDKHRLLLAAVGNFGALIIQSYYRVSSGEPIWARIPRGGWPFPFIDGTEISRIQAHPELEGHDKPNIGFQVSLHEPAILTSQPIVESLARLLQETNRVLDSLAPQALIRARQAVALAA